MNFMLGEDAGLGRFVDAMARRSGGRVMTPSLDDLGGYVIADYLRPAAASLPARSATCAGYDACADASGGAGYRLLGSAWSRAVAWRIQMVPGGPGMVTVSLTGCQGAPSTEKSAL